MGARHGIGDYKAEKRVERTRFGDTPPDTTRRSMGDIPRS